MSVLFVNHREKQCGVHQFFNRLIEPALELEGSYYIDIESDWELRHWVNQLNPSIVVFNFYTHATMPWMNQEVIDSTRAKTLCLFHEVPLPFRFDGIIHQDPTDDTHPEWFKISRPIPRYTNKNSLSNVPTFGSFGFGLGGKGFDKIVEKVQEEYDEAIIRINIPFAAFGDANGRGAGDWARSINSKIHNPNIQVWITHDFMDESKLLDFLAGNTCNCFFYDENYGRGLSGTLDYALAVDRPIAITRSFQFQHFYKYSDACLIENRTLHEIVQGGTKPLDLYHEKWGYEILKKDWQRIFEEV